MNRINEKLFYFFKRIFSFFKEYWIDLLFYIYITFSLYVLVDFFSKYLNKDLIAVIWTALFIPIFLLKLKKDKERTKDYLRKYINLEKDLDKSKNLNENSDDKQQISINGTKNI